MFHLIRQGVVITLCGAFAAIAWADQPVPAAPVHPAQPPVNQALADQNAALQRRIAELEAQVQRLQEENKHLMILAGITPPQDAAEAQAAQVITSVDPQTHATTVQFRATPLKITRGSRDEHWMCLAYTHEGTAASADAADVDSVTLQITNRLSSGLYDGMEAISIAVDGQVFVCPVISYDANLRSRGGAGARSKLYDESIEIRVPIDTLQQMAHAMNVELRLRQVRAQLDAQQIAQCLAFESRLNPPVEQ